MKIQYRIVKDGNDKYWIERRKTWFLLFFSRWLEWRGEFNDLKPADQNLTQLVETETKRRNSEKRVVIVQIK